MNATDILVEFEGIVEALKADLRERRGGYLVKVAEISGSSDPTGRTRNNLALHQTFNNPVSSAFRLLLCGLSGRT